MKCPACARELSIIDAGEGVLLDICDTGCGGMFFDNFELEKFDEAHEMVDSEIFNIVPPHPLTGDNVAEQSSPKRPCPRCENIKMRRFFFSSKRAIQIDQCAGCGGDWLDFDELQKIRGEFKTAGDREKAATALFGVMFDDKIAEARAESNEKVAEAQKFQRMFKILAPSTWFK